MAENPSDALLPAAELPPELAAKVETLRTCVAALRDLTDALGRPQRGDRLLASKVLKARFAARSAQNAALTAFRRYCETGGDYCLIWGYAPTDYQLEQRFDLSRAGELLEDVEEESPSAEDKRWLERLAGEIARGELSTFALLEDLDDIECGDIGAPSSD